MQGHSETKGFHQKANLKKVRQDLNVVSSACFSIYKEVLQQWTDDETRASGLWSHTAAGETDGAAAAGYRTAPPGIATLVAAAVPAMRPRPGREEDGTGTIPNAATDCQAFSHNFLTAGGTMLPRAHSTETKTHVKSIKKTHGLLNSTHTLHHTWIKRKRMILRSGITFRPRDAGIENPFL